MSHNNMRADFEAWVSEQPYGMETREREKVAWSAWQAARSSAPAAKGVEPLIASFEPRIEYFAKVDASNAYTQRDTVKREREQALRELSTATARILALESELKSLSQPQGEARAAEESEEAWRVSKSGFSIKQGWGDDCRIVTKYAGDPVNIDGQKFNKWLNDAQAICDAYNAALTRPTQEAGDAVNSARYLYLRNQPTSAIKQGGIFIGQVPQNLILTEEEADAAIDAAISAARDVPTAAK